MTDYIDFEWFETDKKILRKTSRGGDDVGLRLSSRIHDGEVVYQDGEKTYIAKILPCKLLRITAASRVDLGRICYELGNRHLPVAIAEGYAETPFDAPLGEHLAKLGFKCEETFGVFSGYIYGGHHHG
ncbi:MAG: urease accessory protein UreE [Oscillospiraceae bacterium]|jgi:urease accessory protein|nr:urease accessory protein UreE [Oscillospiraceae bacterium]